MKRKKKKNLQRFRLFKIARYKKGLLGTTVALKRYIEILQTASLIIIPSENKHNLINPQCKHVMQETASNASL